MDVVIRTPYRLEETAGNSVTALRLSRQLEEGGLKTVLVGPEDQVPQARCLVALNAWRSHSVIMDFEGPVVILLTGTDVNDERVSDQSWSGFQAMERADRLVVLQREARERLTLSQQEKCVVILPSAMIPSNLQTHRRERDPLRVVLAARLRAEKRADLVAEACHLLPKKAPVSLEWFGGVGDSEVPHLTWRGAVPQQQLWQEMAEADVFLNASSEEGGANAVCEAIALGLPVLASRIGGNVGLLGDDYRGYFESGNAAALAERLMRLPEDLAELREQVEEKSGFYRYEREAEEWVNLIKGVL